MSSFDKEDDRAKYMVPKSVNDGKVVKLSQKSLATKKLVRKILPEEQYIANLDKIIEKDYFPELKKLQAQKEYLEAVANKDVTKIRELQMKFCSGKSVRTDRSRLTFQTPDTSRTTLEEGTSSSSTVREPSPTFDSETPGPSVPSKHDWMNTPLPFANEEGDNEALARKKRKKNSLNLTSYLNKFTSEDNASFEELAKVMREREDDRRKWLYKAEDEHNKHSITHNAIAAEADVQLALKYVPNADDSRPVNVDNWKYTAWNTVLFNPDGAQLTVAEAAEAARKQQIEINKKATRLPTVLQLKPTEESRSRAAANHALHNAGRVDILGHEVTSTSSMKLLATPNPDPEVMDSPLMTWGEIDGTPFRLDAPDVTDSAFIGAAPTFKIPAVPYRERIAQTINDSIASKYRDKRKVAMKAAEGAHRTPKFGTSRRVSEKLAQLSPAAQKLATKKLGLKMGAKSPFKSPSSNHSSSWTRTPVTNWGEKTPGSSWSQGARTPGTPGIDSMIRRKRDPPTPKEAQPNERLSSPDGGKRAKAGDFF